MNIETICRTCLGREKFLNPIFRNPSKSMRYSIAIYMIAGLKVEMDDGLPQKMCTSCITSLNSAINFRKKCKDAEAYLLQMTNKIVPTKPIAQPEESIICEKYPDITAKDDTETACIKKEGEEFLEFDIDIDNDNENSSKDLVKDEKLLEKASKDDILQKFEKEERKRRKKLEKENQNNEIEPLYRIVNNNDKTERVICNLCQKELSIRSINRHLSTRHPAAGAHSGRCKLCDIRATSGPGCLHCRYCKTEFGDRKSLIDHIATCTPKEKRKPSKRDRELTECDVCHKAMQRASLRLHKAVKHKGLGPVCEHCGRKFGNSIRLNEHLRAKHGYEKFKCSSCEYQSASELALRNHERRHRGEKPFVCETCGASFHAAYILLQHRHSHRPDKTVKCDQCPASFKTNNNLLMHKQTCHSTKTFVCLLCSRAYRCRNYAVKHLRLVHQYKGKTPPVGVVKAGDSPSFTSPSFVAPSSTAPSLIEGKGDDRNVNIEGSITL